MMLFKDFAGITGYTMKPAITTKEFIEVPKREERLVDQKSYQPDSRYFKSGTGPEAWSTYTYTRNRTLFGIAEAKDLTFTANKEDINIYVYGYYHSSKFYAKFTPGDDSLSEPTEDVYENEISGEKGKIYIDLRNNKNYIFEDGAFTEVV